MTTTVAAAEAVAPEGAMFWSRPNLAGEHYISTLGRLHTTLKPTTYFEIGVDAGATLRLAECAAIGVDPLINASLKTPFLGAKPCCHLYRMKSDAFFAANCPTAILGHPIDMAFLDGMHLFEYLLRDFINTEKHCRPNSIICLHDCIPPDSHVARRETGDLRCKDLTSNTNWWAGDVWKVVHILKTYRPDLKIYAFDSAPTGLVVVTGLDPSSTVLSNLYFDIVQKLHSISLIDYGDRYMEILNILETKTNSSPQSLGTMFWL